ncbi:MAG: hypothetical protein KIS61_16665 [Candidatus Eremiobacteraeota bacterium]|nr:hypothetical protein [Candidatus Eremiobacteraeota bacterium]
MNKDREAKSKSYPQGQTQQPTGGGDVGVILIQVDPATRKTTYQVDGGGLTQSDPGGDFIRLTEVDDNNASRINTLIRDHNSARLRLKLVSATKASPPPVNLRCYHVEWPNGGGDGKLHRITSDGQRTLLPTSMRNGELEVLCGHLEVLPDGEDDYGIYFWDTPPAPSKSKLTEIIAAHRMPFLAALLRKRGWEGLLEAGDFEGTLLIFPSVPPRLELLQMTAKSRLQLLVELAQLSHCRITPLLDDGYQIRASSLPVPRGDAEAIKILRTPHQWLSQQTKTVTPKVLADALLKNPEGQGKLTFALGGNQESVGFPIPAGDPLTRELGLAELLDDYCLRARCDWNWTTHAGAPTKPVIYVA